MIVRDLMPGMAFEPNMMLKMQGITDPIVFVQKAPHPLYQGLMLVIWKMPEDSGFPGDWSMDALDPRQDVGQPLPFTAVAIRNNLQAALRPGR